ncbi:hypothetical protein LSTR_LSTR017184 [Laodelphax striatellus]|uniref:Uncharacterized protein n=1 Tax=Laodelphax striatellus TaxID=195883 RepID=A0A482XB72_LAOST|nr:hypothetical protein LSTR_LSTR014892 [Laodelphax striatellus]RZF42996.1 hypothetical protein LSTR_LSTR017184 [Laodelphax striatellus]
MGNIAYHYIFMKRSLINEISLTIFPIDQISELFLILGLISSCQLENSIRPADCYKRAGSNIHSGGEAYTRLLQLGAARLSFEATKEDSVGLHFRSRLNRGEAEGRGKDGPKRRGVEPPL